MGVASEDELGLDITGLHEARMLASVLGYGPSVLISGPFDTDEVLLVVLPQNGKISINFVILHRECGSSLPTETLHFAQR